MYRQLLSADNFIAIKMQKITIKDKNYPVLLKKIPNPPSELYIEGDLRAKENYPLAVVGTRKISDYGRQATEYFVKELAGVGMTIVSGLALGVDGLAHQATLNVGGRTIAVLGSGLENIYPGVHKKLAEKIIKSGGAVISEYPPKTRPAKKNFPERNRIISGLSLGVLVVEAPIKSGALLTTLEALKQKRKIFAIPGRIYDKNSAGTNYLIKKGARAVVSPGDILKEFKINKKFIQGRKEQNLSDEERLILKFLNQKPVQLDELARKSNLKINELVAVLIKMELKGLVRNFSGGKYIRS